MPKVSVIVSIYNTEDYLGECLDSLLMQTLEDIEVICVDDGSKDDCLSSLQGYAFFDSRLKIITQEHAGSASARNKGLSEATGEYVFFANSYDLFDVNLLETMVNQAEKDGSDLVIDGYSTFDNNLKEVTTIHKIPQKWVDNSPCRPQDLSDELFSTFPAVIWNKLIRMDLIKKYDLAFDETICHMSNQAFNAMVLIGAEKISVINNCLTCHRINIDFYKKTDELETFENTIQMFADLFDRMCKNALDKEFDIPYYIWLKNFIWDGLDALPTNKRGDGLKSVLKYLPQKVIDKMISPSKYEPKMSIIVPVYNAAEFLPECLDSLINQTLKEIEIICVNDGSTDNSLDILNAYAQKDNRIKVLSQENQGQAIARNKAVTEATGTYIQYVDADDYLEPNACELLYTYARFYALDMLSFSGIEFNHKTRVEFEDAYHTLSWLPEKFPSVFMWNMVNKDMPKLSVTACLTIYRRMHLLKNQIEWMNKKMVFEDTPYFIESAFKNARIGTIKVPLYHRRIHSEATTHRMDKYFNDLIFMYKYTLNMLQDMDIPKNIILSYAELFFNKVYLNYVYLEKSVKETEDKNLFDFCLYMRKEYYLQYSKNFQNWIQVRLKSKDLKERILFKLYGLYSKLNQDKFIIPFFEYKKAPDFSIKLLSLPVIEVQTKKQNTYSMTCKIFGIPFIHVRETLNH